MAKMSEMSKSTPESLSHGSHDCIIYVDMQNDFCKYGKDGMGSLAVSNADSIIPALNFLREKSESSENNVLIVCTQDWHPKNHMSFASTYSKEPFTEMLIKDETQMLWPDHCVQHSIGAEFHPSFKTKETDIIIKKGLYNVDSYSGFGAVDKLCEETGLREILIKNNVKRVFVCGIAADYCVKFTALDASIYSKLETYYITDGTMPVDIKNMDRVYNELKDANVHMCTIDEASKML